MKKLFAILAVSAFVFAACGQKAAETEEPVVEEPVVEETVVEEPVAEDETAVVAEGEEVAAECEEVVAE